MTAFAPEPIAGAPLQTDPVPWLRPQVFIDETFSTGEAALTAAHGSVA